MSKQKTWGSPGWPWELESLTLVFVLVSLAVPCIVDGSASEGAGPVPPSAIGRIFSDLLRERCDLLWAGAIAILYVMHLVAARASLRAVSTPWVHLVSPLAFALLGYGRLCRASGADSEAPSVITGSSLQVMVLVLGVAAITLMMARVSTERHLLRFNNTKWDLVTRAPYDRSYLRLLSQIRPLVYPPHLYRACDEGLLVQGWFYLMPVPFQTIETVTAVNTVSSASPGRYHASSAHTLLRLELLNQAKPLFISPESRAELQQYCAQHLDRAKKPAPEPAPARQPARAAGAPLIRRNESAEGED